EIDQQYDEGPDQEDIPQGWRDRDLCHRPSDEKDSSCVKHRNHEDDHCRECEPERDALGKHKSAERCGGKEDGTEGKGLLKRHVSVLLVEWHEAPDQRKPCLWQQPGPTMV